MIGDRGALLACVGLIGSLVLPGQAAAIPNNAIGSKQVKPDSLKGSDIFNGTIKGIDIAAETITGEDVMDDTLTGADIDESSLKMLPFAESSSFAGSPLFDVVRDGNAGPAISARITSQAQSSSPAIQAFSERGAGLEARSGSETNFANAVNALATGVNGGFGVSAESLHGGGIRAEGNPGILAISGSGASGDAIQIGQGYLKLPIFLADPPAEDCNNTSEIGRVAIRIDFEGTPDAPNLDHFVVCVDNNTPTGAAWKGL
jgi:hypothetical protein